MSDFSVKEIWKSRFGKAVVAFDYTGREMRIADFGNHSSDYEPTLDHIRPLANGGTDELDNIILCNRLTNSEKKDTFPTWRANEKLFQARRERGKKNKYTIGGAD